MLNKIVITFALLLVFPFSLVYAQNISIALKASTLGVGLEAQKTFTDSFGGRIGINYFTYDYDGTKDDIDYNLDLNLLSVSALLGRY